MKQLTGLLAFIFCTSMVAQNLERGLLIPHPNDDPWIQKVEEIFVQADGSVDIQMVWRKDQGQLATGGRYITRLNSDGSFDGYYPMIGVPRNGDYWTPSKTVEFKPGHYFQFSNSFGAKDLTLTLAIPGKNVSKRNWNYPFYLLAPKPTITKKSAYFLTLLNYFDSTSNRYNLDNLGLLKVDLATLNIDTIFNIKDKQAQKRWRKGALKVNEIQQQFTWLAGDSIFKYDYANNTVLDEKVADTAVLEVNSYFVFGDSLGHICLRTIYETGDTLISTEQCGQNAFPNFKIVNSNLFGHQITADKYIVYGADETVFPNNSLKVKASAIILNQNLKFISQHWYDAFGLNVLTAFDQDSLGNQYLGGHYSYLLKDGYFSGWSYYYTSKAYIFKVDPDGSIIQKISLKQILIYPNPVSKLLQFDAPSTPEKLKIFDTNGKIVLKGEPTIDEECFAFDVSKLAAGTYYLRLLYMGNKERFSPTKFLKE